MSFTPEQFQIYIRQALRAVDTHFPHMQGVVKPLQYINYRLAQVFPHDFEVIEFAVLREGHTPHNNFDEVGCCQGMVVTHSELVAWEEFAETRQQYVYGRDREGVYIATRPIDLPQALTALQGEWTHEVELVLDEMRAHYAAQNLDESTQSAPQSHARPRI